MTWSFVARQRTHVLLVAGAVVVLVLDSRPKIHVEDLIRKKGKKGWRKTHSDARQGEFIVCHSMAQA